VKERNLGSIFNSPEYKEAIKKTLYYQSQVLSDAMHALVFEFSKAVGIKWILDHLIRLKIF
jgi:hypothetical protein